MTPANKKLGIFETKRSVWSHREIIIKMTLFHCLVRFLEGNRRHLIHIEASIKHESVRLIRTKQEINSFK